MTQSVNVLFKVQLWMALGGLAQLARAPALQAGGQRFESVILHIAAGLIIPSIPITPSILITLITPITLIDHTARDL